MSNFPKYVVNTGPYKFNLNDGDTVPVLHSCKGIHNECPVGDLPLVENCYRDNKDDVLNRTGLGLTLRIVPSPSITSAMDGTSKCDAVQFGWIQSSNRILMYDHGAMVTDITGHGSIGKMYCFLGGATPKYISCLDSTVATSLYKTLIPSDMTFKIEVPEGDDYTPSFGYVPGSIRDADVNKVYRQKKLMLLYPFKDSTDTTPYAHGYWRDTNNFFKDSHKNITSGLTFNPEWCTYTKRTVDGHQTVRDVQMYPFYKVAPNQSEYYPNKINLVGTYDFLMPFGYCYQAEYNNTSGMDAAYTTIYKVRYYGDTVYNPNVSNGGQQVTPNIFTFYSISECTNVLSTSVKTEQSYGIQGYSINHGNSFFDDSISQSGDFPKKAFRLKKLNDGIIQSGISSIEIPADYPGDSVQRIDNFHIYLSSRDDNNNVRTKVAFLPLTYKIRCGSTGKAVFTSISQ